LMSQSDSPAVLIRTAPGFGAGLFPSAVAWFEIHRGLI
jgi:hypothetical protein